MKDLTLYETIHLLAIVRRADSAYGVTIKDEIHAMTGREISYGTLYSYLDQLYRKGLVKKSTGPRTPDRRGRRRIFYTVTAAGAIALQTAYELHKSIWTGTPEFVLREGRS
jgi:PadR family transcriptional regulator PadR